MPTGPLVGLKLVITVGGGPVVTVNDVDDGGLMPPVVVTLIGPGGGPGRHRCGDFCIGDERKGGGGHAAGEGHAGETGEP